MQTNVMAYLDAIVNEVPEKTAYSDGKNSETFLSVHTQAKAIGSYLCSHNYSSEPIVVFMRKHPQTVIAFFGVIYSGNYYVPIDDEMPRHRIELIFKSLNPRMVICGKDTLRLIEELDYSGEVCLYSDICDFNINESLLLSVREKAIDTDPIYIVFTSGSTGLPKGVAACHRSVIDYIESLSQVLEFSGGTVFGNQTPLYVDACLKEIFPTVKFGATTYLIPKSLFMFPFKLVDFLNDYKINTICWVVSALTMISGLDTLDKNAPKYLTTIAFGSEVFPMKQFYKWRAALPNAKFINLYGPTEATGMSCYYKVERDFGLDEALPIGRPFRNTEIIVIDDNKRVTSPNQVGEICIRGTCLTLGYFNDCKRTSQSFVQNPLNTHYPEIIYRTGDLGKYNEYGELVFVSRKDNQIKHMGYRIELGEIETAAGMQDGIQRAACVYHNNKIILFYAGNLNPGEVASYLKKQLPRYMLPAECINLENMPLTPNGKIDRVYLKKLSQ